LFVEEGKAKDIVLAADLEGKAVPGYPVATGFSPPRGGGGYFACILLLNIGKRQRVFKDPQTAWGTRVHGCWGL
jgi:hypothetical protein